MQLKEYQLKVLERLESFLETLSGKEEEARAFVDFMQSRGQDAELANYCRETWDELNRQRILPFFRDRRGVAHAADYLSRYDGLKRPIPNICFKIPTGGGKTLLAASAVERVNTQYFKRQTGFVLWIVPTDSIYKQTWKALADREHPYRQMLERASGGRVRMLEKGDAFTKTDTREYLCVMLLMLQSSARRSKETLRMFRDSGQFTSFFPELDDFDANRKLLDEVPNLETNDLADADFIPGGLSIKQSLGNTLKLVRPIIVMDEGHKAYSETALNTLNGFNPRFLLELSATPNTGTRRLSNILVDVSGAALKEEQMIKIPIRIQCLPGSDWKQTLTESHDLLSNQLNKAATEVQAKEGRYIRPIMLVRVDRTGNDQRDKAAVHAEDAREFLIDKLGVKPEEIKVKSATVDEIGKEDLMSNLSDVRYIITKDALREGWDCPFAYVLTILSRTTAATALTQMIGRVLRQPGALRTECPELNECYIFCHDQDVNKAVESVRKGLEEEGMSDLGEEVRATGTQNATDEIQRIKLKVREKFSEPRVFLPRVLHKNTKGDFEPLDYEHDILSGLDWSGFSYSEANRFSPNPEDHLERIVTKIDIVSKDDGELEFPEERAVQDIEEHEPLDFAFLSRLLMDVIPNPWQCSRILEETLATLKERGISETKVFISRLELIKAMKADLRKQVLAASEALFVRKLERGEIVFKLTASEDNKLNWKLAQNLEVSVADSDRVQRKKNNESLERSYFETVYEKQLNGFERDMAWYVDGQAAVKWWHRLAVRQDYHLQGWQREKVYPDFLVCMADEENGKVRFSMLETKGEHLKGNDDSAYKKKLFEILSAQSAAPMESGQMDLLRKDCQMTFKMLMENTWRAEVETALS